MRLLCLLLILAVPARAGDLSRPADLSIWNEALASSCTPEDFADFLIDPRLRSHCEARDSSCHMRAGRTLMRVCGAGGGPVQDARQCTLDESPADYVSNPICMLTSAISIRPNNALGEFKRYDFYTPGMVATHPYPGRLFWLSRDHVTVEESVGAFVERREDMEQARAAAIMTRLPRSEWFEDQMNLNFADRARAGEAMKRVETSLGSSLLDGTTWCTGLDYSYTYLPDPHPYSYCHVGTLIAFRFTDRVTRVLGFLDLVDDWPSLPK